MMYQVAETLPAVLYSAPTEPLQQEAAPSAFSSDAFRGGKSSEAEAVFREFWPTMYRAAFRLLMAHDEAEDAAQESFVKAWQRRAEFRGSTTESMGAWLLSITRRTALDHLRKRAKRVPLEAAAQHAAKNDPAADAESKETCDEVRSAIAALDPGDQAALVLFEIEEVPQAEIASGMGITVNALKVRLHRARRRFRESYVKLLTSKKREGEYHV